MGDSKGRLGSLQLYLLRSSMLRNYVMFRLFLPR